VRPEPAEVERASLARAGEMVYKGAAGQPPTKETSMKLILAAILAGSFLVSLPVKADDKPADAKADKGKKDKKADKGEKKDDKSASKPAGGGW
jgi:hypothetical protein